MDPQFITRKTDHIRVALQPESQASSFAHFDQIRLVHDSLPDFDLSDVNLEQSFNGERLATPFFIAGMTAGRPDAHLINERLARFAEKRGWAFGLGSQRREMDSTFADQSITDIAEKFPQLKIISNLGIAQLIEVASLKKWSQLKDLLARSRASAFAIHLNPLQEAVQAEGTPRFKGSMAALEKLKTEIALPIVLKETGSGMSLPFLKRIARFDFFAVDVSGLGGTHWGRVEGLRADPQSQTAALGACFENWGISTIDSVQNAQSVFQSQGAKTQIWASGGLRSGLDAAKCLALGAHRVGYAQPALAAALQGDANLEAWMQTREAELRVALFCTGSQNLRALDSSKIEKGRNRHE